MSESAKGLAELKGRLVEISSKLVVKEEKAREKQATGERRSSEHQYAPEQRRDEGQQKQVRRSGQPRPVE